MIVSCANLMTDKLLLFNQVKRLGEPRRRRVTEGTQKIVTEARHGTEARKNGAREERENVGAARAKRDNVDAVRAKRERWRREGEERECWRREGEEVSAST